MLPMDQIGCLADNHRPAIILRAEEIVPGEINILWFLRELPPRSKARELLVFASTEPLVLTQ